MLASVLLLSPGFRWALRISEAPGCVTVLLPTLVSQEDASGVSLLPPAEDSSDPPSLAIPVLMFHMFTYDSSLWNYMIISPQAFRSYLLALQQAGYTSVHPHEIVSYVEGRGELPDKPVLITVDDGYRDNYTLGFPILQELGMKATFFVIGALTNNDQPTLLDYFNWDEAREMYESGLVSIQPHSYDLHNKGDLYRQLGKGVSRHGHETDKDYEERFLGDTKKIIDMIWEKVGDKSVAYSYPYGLHNPHTEDMLFQLGIRMTVTVTEGVAATGDGLALTPRINVPHGLSTERLLKRIQVPK